jgi:2-phospho-L-lactate/phosphoenolpyruvate guanylyltransferase
VSPGVVGCVIPVKPLGGALGRLGGVLGPGERRTLQSAMLADVLAACAGARRVGEALVVTADPDATRQAALAGAGVVADHEPPRGMNPAVALGLEALAARGARAALVLVGDLPLAAAADLDALVGAAPRGRGVALAPSRDGTGTNALLLRPPTVLRTALGPDSLARHLAGAAHAGLRMALVERPGLALDIDTPEDLAAFWASGRPGATREVCTALEVAERLGALAPR